MDGVYVEISMNPNDQYGLWTIVFLIRLTEESVNNHLREFNFPQKNTNELGPAWHIVGNHRIRGQKKIAFSYSDPGGTLEKIKHPETLIQPQVEPYVSKEVKENAFCISGQILPTSR